MDQLNIGVESDGAEASLEQLAASVRSVHSALVALSDAPADRIRAQLAGVTGAFGMLAKTVEGSMRQAQVAAAQGGRATGKAMADALAAGMDVSAQTVRDQVRLIQRKYESHLAKGWRMTVPVLMDLKAQGVSLSPADKLRMRESVFRSGSATKLSEGDIRSLLGMPSRDEMKSFSASLKAQMQEGLTVEKLRTRSASRMTENDLRNLLGAPSRDEMKSFSASLKAQMQEGLTVEKLRARSASKVTEDDLRSMWGLPPRQEMDRFASELRARMQAQAASIQLAARGQVAQATSAASGTYQLLKDRAFVTPGAAKVPNMATPDPRKLLEVSSASRVAAKDLNDMRSAARGVASGFNAMWLTWGNLLPLLAGSAVSNAFVQSVRKGAQFQQTLASIGALAGQTSAELEQVSAKAIEMGLEGPFGPLEMVDAFKTLALAGQSAREQMESIGAVRSFAIVGETDMKASAEGLVAIATAYGYSAENFSVVGDIVSRTAAASMASVSDMTQAFRQASVVAQQYGVTLEDTSVNLALLSQIGITGSAAGTAMRNMYTELMGTSKKARKVLDDELGVKVWDDVAKAMKPLPVVMEEMSTALSKFDSSSIQKLLIDLGNERGTKQFVANFASMTQMVTDDSGKLVTQFQRVRDEIRKAPGYMAVSAALMQQTTANLGKSVAASLESALIESFNRTEPAIQALAVRLKELFGSEEFRSSVSSLAGSMAELLGWFVKHADVLASVAKAYVVYKGASLAAQLATSGMARAVVMLTASSAPQFLVTLTQLYRGAAIAATGGAGASTAMATAIGAVGPGATRAAAGVRILMASLGPVTALLTGAYVAWSLFSDSAKDPGKGQGSTVDDLVADRKSLMSSVDQEIERLKRLEEARTKNIDSMLAEAKVQRDLARERVTTSYDAQLKALSAEETGALGRLSKSQKGYGMLNSNRPSQVDRQREEIELKFFERRRDLLQEQGRELAKLDELQALSMHRHQVAAKEAEDARKALVTGTKEYDPDSAGGDSSARFTLPADNLIKQMERQYGIALQTTQDYTGTQKTLLDNAHRAEAISLGTYKALELGLIESSERQQLDVINSFTARILEAYDARRQTILGKLAEVAASALSSDQKKGQREKLQAELGNLSNAMDTFKELTAGNQSKLENSLLVRTRQQADEARGALRKLDEEQRKFAESEENLAQVRRADAQFELGLSGTGDAKAAVLRAEYDERKRLLDLDREQALVIAERERVAKDFQATAQASSASYTLTGTFGGDYSPEQRAAVKAMNDELERMRKIRQDMADSAAGKIGAAGQDTAMVELSRMADLDLASVFDRANISINGMNTGLGDAVGHLMKMADNAEVYEKAKKSATKGSKEEADIDKKILQNRIKGYGDLVGSLKGFFKEGTKGYKALETAETAFRAAEVAMALHSTAVKLFGINSVTAATVTGQAVQGGAEAAGTALSVGQTVIRTAAKAKEALVSALGAPFPANLAAFGIVAGMLATLGVATGAIGGTKGSFAPTNSGTGTVLGDSGAKSESIANSSEYLESIETITGVTLTYTRQMAASLRNLESQMGGMASLITRNGSVTARGDAVDVGFMQSTADKLLSNAVRSTAAILTGGLSELLGLGDLLGGLFGKKISVKGQGFVAGPQGLQSVLDSGLNLQNYADVETKRKTLGITTSTKNSTVTGAADAETARQFSLVLTGLADTVRQAAEPLAGSAAAVQAAMAQYTVNLGRIELSGLNGEQVQERLTAVFSAEGDRMAKAVMPGLEAFQQVGEGYFETLVRVSSTLEAVNDTFSALGNTLSFVGIQGVGLSTSLVKVFGGIEGFQASLSGYYENFYSESERNATTRSRISSSLQGLGFSAMPETRDEFRAMVDAFVAGGGLLTESGQEVYAQMIALSDPFAQITEAAEDMGKTLVETADDILAYVQKLSGERGGLATPMQQLTAARSTYVGDLTAARTGDADALERLTSSADSYIEAQKAVTASSSYTQAVIDQIIAELTGVGNATKASVPAFAAGGYHAGGWAVVGEKGAELAYFDSPARIYSASQSAQMGDNTAVVAELRAVRAELTALRAQQDRETQAVIGSNIAAHRAAAGEIVEGVAEASERQAWLQQSAPEIQ